MSYSCTVLQKVFQVNMILDTITVSRLTLCEDLEHASCGDVLFHGYLNPPGQCMYYRSKTAG